MSCRFTKPHVAHLTISGRKAEKCPGVPADQPAPAGDDELREAERTVRSLAQNVGHSAWSEVLMAEYDERGRERDAARAEVERLRRALAGHLFDGESLSTREALRSELIEQGLKDSAELERLHAWAEAAKAVVRAWRANEAAPFEGTTPALFELLDALAAAHEEAP